LQNEKVTKELDYKNVRFENQKALIVDDAKFNRFLFVELFKKINLDFVEADNGEQASNYARKHKPDIILMDLRMPIMNGYEATRILKQEPDTKDIPVIAVTASAMKRDKEKIMESKFDSYLVKPVQMKELLNILTQFLPYSVQKPPEDEMQNIPSTKSEKVPQHSAELLKEIAAQLSGSLYDKWKEISENHLINEIIGFSEIIVELGKNNNIEILVEFGENLSFHAKNFDTQNVEKIIRMYPDLIKRIEKRL